MEDIIRTKSIEEQADKIINDRKALENYICKCKEAGICPKCAAPIIKVDCQRVITGEVLWFRTGYYLFGYKCSKCSWDDTYKHYSCGDW